MTVIPASAALAPTEIVTLSRPQSFGKTEALLDTLRLPACESLGRSVALGDVPCADDFADAAASVGRFPEGPPIAPVAAVAERPAPTAKPRRRKARR